MNKSADRRAREREQLRARILTAARELLVSEGVDGFSMRKLADKIAYTPTAIYFHFRDKETLLRELMSLDFLAFRRALGGLGHLDPIERLMQMGASYVEFAVRFPNHYRLLFLTTGAKGHVDEGRVERGNPAEDAYAFLRTTVSEALALGRFRPELTDADELAQIIWGSLHGLVAIHLVLGGDQWLELRPVESTAERLISALMAGLLRDSKDAANTTLSDGATRPAAATEADQTRTAPHDDRGATP